MLASGALRAQAQSPATSSSTSANHVKKTVPPGDAGIDPGAVSNGIYRNKSLGFSCKISEGWVLRTDEMNAEEGRVAPQSKSTPHPGTKPEDQSPHPVAESATRVGHPAPSDPSRAALDRTAPSAPLRTGEGGCPHTGCGKVLLAAFSRPPEARGEEVNASIVIAAESAATYPGLKEAGQYFEPLTEVAKAQGFTVDEEPYELAIGTKTLVRGDFHKDVGTRVMRQSTLVMLAHGYAVSFTVIGGTWDEVEDLLDGLDFAAGGKAPTK